MFKGNFDQFVQNQTNPHYGLQCGKPFAQKYSQNTNSPIMRSTIRELDTSPRKSLSPMKNQQSALSPRRVIPYQLNRSKSPLMNLSSRQSNSPNTSHCEQSSILSQRKRSLLLTEMESHQQMTPNAPISLHQQYLEYEEQSVFQRQNSTSVISPSGLSFTKLCRKNSANNPNLAQVDHSNLMNGYFSNKKSPSNSIISNPYHNLQSDRNANYRGETNLFGKLAAMLQSNRQSNIGKFPKNKSTLPQSYRTGNQAANDNFQLGRQSQKNDQTNIHLQNIQTVQSIQSPEEMEFINFNKVQSNIEYQPQERSQQYRKFTRSISSKESPITNQNFSQSPALRQSHQKQKQSKEQVKKEENALSVIDFNLTDSFGGLSAGKQYETVSRKGDCLQLDQQIPVEGINPFEKLLEFSNILSDSGSNVNSNSNSIACSKNKDEDEDPQFKSIRLMLEKVKLEQKGRGDFEDSSNRLNESVNVSIEANDSLMNMNPGL